MTATLKLTVPASVAPNTPFVVSWTMTENYVMAYTDDGLTLLPLPAGSGIPAPTVNQGSWIHPGLAASGVITMQETSKVNVSGRVGVTVKAMPVESASGATLNSTAGSIVDSLGNVWTLVQSTGRGLQFSCNGVTDAPTGNVASGLYWGPPGGARKLYQVNKTPTWYVNNGAIGNWSQIAGDPRVPVIAPVQPVQPAGSNFKIANGQVIAPNGKPFITKGICMTDQSMVSAATLISKFPGLNIVNFALGSEGGGYQTAIPVSQILGWTADANSKGLIVILSDYPPGQPGPRTGQDLVNMQNWIASLAQPNAYNPNVWFTTPNEIAGPVGPLWRATYDAVRGAGNGGLIFLESAWGSANHTFDADASVPPNMTGVGWNIHSYPGGTAADIAMWQSFARSRDGIMPVLAGENGPSSDGTNINDNLSVSGNYQWMQGIDDLTTNKPGGFCGYTGWVWSFNNGQYSGGDAMVNAGTQNLTMWGQQMARMIAARPPG